MSLQELDWGLISRDAILINQRPGTFSGNDVYSMIIGQSARSLIIVLKMQTGSMFPECKKNAKVQIKDLTPFIVAYIIKCNNPEF
jgi:hypothetical protein